MAKRWLGVAAAVLVAGPAGAADLFKGTGTTFSELAWYHDGCTGPDGFSGPCQAAVSRLCRAKGYESGFGPVEYNGDDAVAVCAASQAAQSLQTTFSELAWYHDGCTASNAFSGDCQAAASRLCKAKGYESGLGPVEYYGDSAVAVCAASQAAKYIETSFPELAGHHEGCVGPDGFSGACRAAVSRLCRAKGYESGLGPVEYNPVSVGAACVMAELAPPSAPSVAIASPADGATVSGTVAVEGSLSSTLPVPLVELFVDGKSSARQFMPAAGSFSMTLDTKGLTNGSHALAVNAYDVSGGTGAASVIVVVSNAVSTAPLPSPSSEHARDADGVLWGTESAVAVADASSLSEGVRGAVSAVNGALKTNLVKFRLALSSLSQDGTGYSPVVCLPTPQDCRDSSDLDETAKLFKANSWSMVPMLTHDVDKDIDETQIERYAGFVDWFVTRYKTDADIRYVELVNAPGGEWRGTAAQLLDAGNRIYDRVKAGHPGVLVGTPGFEYFADSLMGGDGTAVEQLEHFLDPANGARFDFWAFHGYPSRSQAPQGSDAATYPPTKTSATNKYAGSPGILEVRRRLDAAGWKDRPMIDTEHSAALPTLGPAIADSDDAFLTAYHLQDLLVKRTLRHNGSPALGGLLPLKMNARSSLGEFAWGSLNGDGTPTRHVKALGVLLEKLDALPHAGRVSGAFDDEGAAWVEKFESTASRKALYAFFKPFHYDASGLKLDTGTLSCELDLGSVPASLTLTEADGTATTLLPSRTLTLEAVNTPRFLEAAFPAGPSGGQEGAGSGPLRFVKKVEIPGGARPEIAATSDRVFVVYRDNAGAYAVRIYDAAMDVLLSSKTLLAASQAYGTPTDLRVASDGTGLYAFYETASVDKTYLFGARYSLDDAFALTAAAGPLAQSATWSNHQDGDEKLDDPIPLVIASSVVAITRYHASLDASAPTRYKVYEFDKGLRKLRELDLDLSSVADGQARQAGAVYQDGFIHMAVPTTVGTAGAIDLVTPSDIALVKLDSSWNIAGSSNVSTDHSAASAETYVTGFKADSRGFYLAYLDIDIPGIGASGFTAPLKAYDWSGQLVSSAAVRAPKASDEAGLRPSLETRGDRLFIGHESGPMGAGSALVYVYERLDLSSPTVSITSPASGAALAGSAAVEVAASDDAGVVKVELHVDGVLLSSAASAPWPLTLDAASLSSGSHVLQARAYDAAGNMGTSPDVTVSVSNSGSGGGGGDGPSATLFKRIDSTFSELAGYHEGCVGPDGFSGACQAAVSRLCRAKGYESGFGPVEYYGNDAVAACAASQAAKYIETSFSELSGLHEGCVGPEGFTGACQAAVSRLCRAKGYESGWGPVEYNPVSVGAACAASQAAKYIETSFSELSGHHEGCVGPDGFSGACRAAVSRLCRAKGYESGLGPVEYNPVSVGAACVMAELPPPPAPSVTITSPSQGATVSGTVTVEGSAASMLPVPYVELFVDGKSGDRRFLSGASTFTFILDAGSLAGGAHTLAVSAYGLGGSTGTASVDVVVAGAAADSTPPSVSITAPAGGAALSGAAAVAVSASDDVAVSTVEFLVDGIVQASSSKSPFSVDLYTPLLANGAHSLSARAYDAAGNSAASPAAAVTVSNRKPVLPSGEDADGFIWGTETFVDLSDAGISSAVLASISAVNETLKTRYVKVRLNLASLTRDGTGFSPVVCVPTPDNCLTSSNLDSAARVFQANGWSMAPMLTHDYMKRVDEEQIARYVDFVDWFVSRYKDAARIRYVELVNAPGTDGQDTAWQGTPAQLLEASNRVYDRVKSRHPDVLVGSPGFEYWIDVATASDKSAQQVEYFLDKSHGAKFDFWAFHGYATFHVPSAGACAPTKSAADNKYAGIPGILEIRRRLDANGWRDRPMIDTEHGGITATYDTFSPEADALETAHLLQETLLKRTLRQDGRLALAGILPMKTYPRVPLEVVRFDANTSSISTGTVPSDGDLNADGSVPGHVKALGLMLERLDPYRHAAHVGGAFDDEGAAWVERFESTASRKALYAFFKPFRSGGAQLQLDGATLSYELDLGSVPASLTLTEADGTATSLAPARAVTLSAVNTPRFLEAVFPDAPSADATPPAASSASAVLSPGTGASLTVKRDSVGADVVVPAGAFASTAAVTVSVAASFPPDAGGFAGTGAGVRIDAGGLQPARAVAITVSYADAQVAGLDEGRLVLARYDEASGSWVSLKSSADASANAVTGLTGHFSLFQVMQAAAPAAAPPAGELAGMRVYPNPFYPGRGQAAVTVDRVPAGARVRLYTLLGELVWEGSADGSGAASWSGTNRAGRAAASGVYRARVDSAGGSRVKKLSIVR